MFALTKRMASMLLALAILIASLALPAHAAGNQEIHLYYIPEEYVGKVKLPSGARTSYQFPEGSSATYTIDGDPANTGYYRLRISPNGLVTTQKGMLSENNAVEHYTIRVTVNKNIRVVDFMIHNAKYDYADQVLDHYIATEITDDMTELEKADQLRIIVARDFDYQVGHPAWQDFIWYGGGTCWASTGFIVEGCRRLGIPAGMHTEPWESGQHANAIALVDGALWLFKSGYEGTKPRSSWKRAVDGDYFLGFKNQGTEVCLIRYERMFAVPESEKTIIVPDTYMGAVVTEIGASSPNYTLSFCGRETQTLRLPDKLKVINPNACQNAHLLTNLTIPETVTSIGAYAFWGCSSLKRLEIPPLVTRLNTQTFAYCDTLELTVPASVTFIDSECFLDTDITLVVESGSYAESYAKSKGLKYRLLGEATLPASLKHITSGSFQGTGFISIVIPDGALSIGDNAFANCTKLKRISIPASVTSISDSAFSGLSGVTISAPAGSAAAQYAKRKGMTLTTP